jgi:hypothetical protein
MTHHPDLEAACSAALDAAEAHLVKTGLEPHQILVMPEGGNACTGGLGFDDPGELLASLLSYALGMAKELGLDWHLLTMPESPGQG